MERAPSICPLPLHLCGSAAAQRGEYYVHADADLDLLKRVYFANRGVWEANVWAGPAVSVAATHEDVEHYLSVLEEVVGELAA